MRVLSVVTLVSPLGEYGGPLRVAVNQARQLIAHGHDVVIAGSARGYDHLPRDIEGVPAQLHPAVTLLPRVGFAGVGSPGLWRWLRQHATDFDVVHVHAARDLVTLPAARIAASRGVPYVLQPHGMIDPSRRLLARPLDAALTRPVLRGARHVLHLTSLERAGLVEVAGELPLVHVPNGVPPQTEVAEADRPTVLYLARLAPRKRPVLFVEAARRVARTHPTTTFLLVGPDEGEGAAVDEAMARAVSEGVDISWGGALAPDQTVEMMRRASVYVLPSVDEPYPMSVLEAMSVGLPVVVTDTCGLAATVREAQAGHVVDDSLDALVDAIDRLLGDPAGAREEGANGRRLVRYQLSMSSVVRQLESLYSG